VVLKECNVTGYIYNKLQVMGYGLVSGCKIDKKKKCKKKLFIHYIWVSFHFERVTHILVTLRNN